MGESQPIVENSSSCRSWPSSNGSVGEYSTLDAPFASALIKAGGSSHEAELNFYGRDEEIAQLCRAFHRRRSDEPEAELVLVTGPSGTGKTALIIHALRNQVERYGGFFLQGKYDLLERTDAYYPFVRAFSDFVQRLIDGDEVELLQVQHASKSVTAIQTLLVDMIPALQDLFENPVSSNDYEVKGAGAQKRLQFAFGQFLRAICSSERPMCLFLDDLQWAQPASIDLVAFLVEENIPGLLVIGACRGQEIALEHHLSVILRELEANRVSIEAIVLSKLNSTVVAQMIHDFIQTSNNILSGEHVSTLLADLIIEKTDGNALFVVEVIQTLSVEGLLKQPVDNDQEDVLCRIRNRLTGELDLIGEKIQNTPQNVQQVLMLAACLGAEFEEDLLRQLITFEIKDLLTIASTQGLIVPDNYAGTWRFTHDQVQQATYSLIPEEEKEQAHLTIGRKLWTSLTPEQLEAHFFLVVRQLSFGSRLMVDLEERNQFAALLFLAGQKAAQSFTFLTASTYLELGISLLDDRHWRDQYELSMDLFHAAAESEYCNGHYERTDELINDILANARSENEKIRALTISIYSLGTRNEMLKAVALGFKVLQYLNLVIPSKASVISVLFELAKTKRMLRKMPDEEILNLPVMIDEQTLAAMRIMSLMFAYVIHFKPMVGAILAARMVQMSIQHGCSGVSAVGFSSLGMILCNGFGEVDVAIRLGRLSVIMLDKFQSREWIPRVYSACYGLCFSYCDPMRDNLKPLLVSHRVGLVSGDIEFSALSAAMYAGLAINASIPLPQFVDECTAFLRMMQQHNQTNMIHFMTPSLQYAKCLMGDCEDPAVLSGDIMNGEEALQHAIASSNNTIVSYIIWVKLMLASYFCEYELAVKLAIKLSTCDSSNFACYNRAGWYLHESLAVFSLPSLSHWRKMKTAYRNLKRLKTLASYSDHNFTPHLYILEAEIAVAKGHFHQGLAKFNDAIVRARNEKLWQQAGLAYERAARALLRKGRLEEGMVSLEKAMEAYQQWGADAKVASLRTQIASE